MLEVMLYILMAAPSATDDHVMNHAVPIGTYAEAHNCQDAVMWLNEHSMNLPRHVWCMPVQITPEETLFP